MIETRVLTGAELAGALDRVADLRLRVFRDFPYLYDGDMAYERAYLDSYRTSPGAVVVGAFAGAQMIGAATGTPMTDHAEDFATAFAATGLALDKVFYLAESVLLAKWRGQGLGHRFFDLREAHARALGYAHAAFCAVIRADDHPARPTDHRPLDTFWRRRGYAPLPGVIAHFGWKDIGSAEASPKALQFWMRDL